MTTIIQPSPNQINNPMKLIVSVEGKKKRIGLLNDHVDSSIDEFYEIIDKDTVDNYYLVYIKITPYCLFEHSTPTDIYVVCNITMTDSKIINIFKSKMNEILLMMTQKDKLTIVMNNDIEDENSLVRGTNENYYMLKSAIENMTFSYKTNFIVGLRKVMKGLIKISNVVPLILIFTSSLNKVEKSIYLREVKRNGIMTNIYSDICADEQYKFNYTNFMGKCAIAQVYVNNNYTIGRYYGVSRISVGNNSALFLGGLKYNVPIEFALLLKIVDKTKFSTDDLKVSINYYSTNMSANILSTTSVFKLPEKLSYEQRIKMFFYRIVFVENSTFNEIYENAYNANKYSKKDQFSNFSKSYGFISALLFLKSKVKSDYVSEYQRCMLFIMRDRLRYVVKFNNIVKNMIDNVDENDKILFRRKIEVLLRSVEIKDNLIKYFMDMDYGIFE